ncbi:MAG: hypothetical protein AAFR96_09410 [Planctomycetota bacterium]
MQPTQQRQAGRSLEPRAGLTWLHNIAALRRIAPIAVAVCLGHALPGSPAVPTASAQADDAETARLKRDNLAKVLRPISLRVQDQPLRDVVQFVADFSGAQIDPIYSDDRTPDGLDPEAPITLNVTDVSCLRLLELALDQAARESFDGATWQLTSWGSIEAGPKSALNRRQHVRVYDIADLLLALPDYADAPALDLQSVLQSSQGGGGGQSPFTGNLDDNNDEDRDLDERREAIVDLIQAIVEPDQWQAAGGDGGSVTIFQNTLVIRAADYMHRQIDGYRFWPAANQSLSGSGADREASFRLDAESRGR